MILEARQIYKGYSNGIRHLQVLQGLDLQINTGEIVTIMGPSGSGKSTLLNVLGTLDRPDKGEVIIDGAPTAALADLELSRLRNRKIGFVFQFHHLLPEFNALENILLPGLIRLPPVDRTERALELLEYVGLTGRKSHYPSQLSGGERLRVAVIRALINTPQLVLADEPTGNLDLENAGKLVALFQHINTDFHQALVITTHNPEVAAIGQRRYLLEQGALKAVSSL